MKKKIYSNYDGREQKEIKLQRTDRFLQFAYLIGLFIVLITFFGNSTVLNAMEKVSFRCIQNGKYVRGGAGGNNYLAAVSNSVDRWETFELRRLGGDRVAIRSWQSGKWVRIAYGRNKYLANVSNSVSNWEKFRLINRGNNRIALLSIRNSKYVRAGLGNEAFLGAASVTASGWETFEMRPIATQSTSASLVELATQLGCTLVPGAPRGQIRFNCSISKVAEFAGEYLSRTILKLHHRDGHSYMQYRIGPERIPEMDFNQGAPVRVPMRNIYLYGPRRIKLVKIMPKNINQNSVRLTGNRNTLRLRIGFEANGTEFKVEGKGPIGWEDYLVPDAHWDRASITLEISFSNNINRLVVADIRVTSVRGAWGVRAMNGIATNSINRSINGNIQRSLNSIMSDPNKRQHINQVIEKATSAGFLRRAGLDSSLRVGFSNGNFVVTIPNPFI